MKLHKPHLIKRNGLWQAKIKYKNVVRTFHPEEHYRDAFINAHFRIKHSQLTDY